MQPALIKTEPTNQLDQTSFTVDEMQQIRAAVKMKYAAVSTSATGFFKYPVGKEGALSLDYDNVLLEQTPDYLLRTFCGVGNPFAIDQIVEGNYVLDIGCGGGFDLWIASRLTGEKGRVFGVDLTEEMVFKAQSNLEGLQIKNAEIHLISSEQLPFTDNTMDRVISNGVINLSPDKPKLFAEIYRVLKPGGQMQFADIILERELPQNLSTGVESWSQ